MGNPTSLSDYIKEREQRKPQPPRKPAWLRRMEEKGLPNQDRTSYILGSFTPKNDGGAA